VIEFVPYKWAVAMTLIQDSTGHPKSDCLVDFSEYRIRIGMSPVVTAKLGQASSPECLLVHERRSSLLEEQSHPETVEDKVQPKMCLGFVDP
jgi:hypothetical protein